MIQIGDKKVTKMIAGGNVMVNRDDVWLKCVPGNGFAGTPILMHYDPSTKQTMFVGQAAMPWGADKGIYDDTVLTLPSGYHFTSSDGFPIMFNNGQREKYQTLSFDGANMKAKFTWPFSDPTSGIAQLVFGYINSIATSQVSFWQTTIIAPD